MGEECRRLIHPTATVLRGRGGRSERMSGNVVEPVLVRKEGVVEGLKAHVEQEERRRVVVEIAEGGIG